MHEEMKKIVVIGSPGAGKSTFAQALGEILNIEVLHLDRYFWQTGWKEYPREKRIHIQQELLKGKEWWIMEGSYISSADGRFDVADTIIFLDTPRLLCLWRAIKRHIATYHQPLRLDIPEGCTDRLGLFCILKILAFPYRGRAVLRAKIDERKKDQAEQKEIYILRSNIKIEAFLQEMSNRRLKEHPYAEHELEQEGVFDISYLPQAVSSPPLAHRVLACLQPIMDTPSASIAHR